MKNIVAFLLAGGMGSRLNVLAWMRAKPAVPFGGIYRIIDFTLSNVMHSAISHVGILTQYRPHSLMSHIVSGEAWDFIGRSRGAKVLPPSTGINDSDWYLGTADAVAQNLDYPRQCGAEQVLVLSGDHIYHMDYQPMLAFHRERDADITIAMMHVPWSETRHFGVAKTDADGRIVLWQEKPEKAESNLASMGVYIFETSYLEKVLGQRDKHDFGHDVVPHACESGRVYAYPFDGYWADVGTLRAFWQSNMDILKSDSGLELARWCVRTNVEEAGLIGDRPPAFFSGSAAVSNSLISYGCRIEGSVVNSVLSPGVRVERGASVRDSVIMHDVRIERDANLFEVIADKRSRFGTGSIIGSGECGAANIRYPDHVSTGLTVVGKGALVPPGITLQRNTIIEPWVNEESYRDFSPQAGGYLARA